MRDALENGRWTTGDRRSLFISRCGSDAPWTTPSKLWRKLPARTPSPVRLAGSRVIPQKVPPGRDLRAHPPASSAAIEGGKNAGHQATATYSAITLSESHSSNGRRQIISSSVTGSSMIVCRLRFTR